MDIKEAFEYNQLPIYKDSDWAINKSKDPNDCKRVKTSNKKMKGYLDDSKSLIDQKANELKRANF